MLKIKKPINRSFFLVLLVVLIIGIGYLFSSDYIFEKSAPIRVSPTTVFSTITPTIESSNWKTFENEKFKIKYPADWQVGITPLIGDIAPDFKPANQDYPLFQVSVLPLNSYVITCKENGLQEVARIINGVEVIECVGTMTPVRKGRETNEIAQWRNLVIVGKSNKFSFNYLYISDNQNDYYEALFNSLLQSFVIK